MIHWQRYGLLHVGTTDCGLRFEVRRRPGERCYSLTTCDERGRAIEHAVGYESTAAAKAAAAITAAGMQKETQS
jgi:hypothetical protein